MATFDVSGIEGVIKDLQRMGDQAEQIGQEMLLAGADVLRWHWQSAIRSAGHIDTGDMLMSVKADKAAKKSGGVMQIEVYPRGSDASGTRNAEKAYIAHYGRNRQPGSGFVDIATNNAQEPVWSAMETVWDKFIAQ